MLSLSNILFNIVICLSIVIQMSLYPIPKVVAEIGCNHKGQLDIAFELIKLAHEAGASYAKFQKRTPKELLSEAAYAAPHPTAYNSYGNTYGEHREFLELNLKQHQQLKGYCEEIGIGYASSVWDLTSAEEIISLEPDYIKIPSACNNNFELLSLLCSKYSGQKHVSLGMTTADEEKELMAFISSNKPEDFVLYSCTSGYPVPFEDVALLEIRRLKESYGSELDSIGFSGHHLGIAIDIAAYTLGAKWIERHFTKDRTWKGTDHAASLEPAGLSKLIRNLNATHASLSYKSTEILEIEQSNRDKLKYKK